jgi:hypothetical protein
VVLRSDYTDPLGPELLRDADLGPDQLDPTFFHQVDQDLVGLDSQSLGIHHVLLTAAE